ncbi:MAG: hypothetical protein EAZ55_08825 [Cytophagales bacterium]|nr:MAG: hypothetical protein EAZ55_08825 [Cytophagales bacterium]
MKKIFENQYAELYDISEEVPQTIFGYWKGFWLLDDEEAMKALHFPFEYVEKNAIKIMITDYQFLEVVPPETNEWLEQVWFPTIVQKGLKAEIVLDATSLTAKLSVEFMYENVNQTGLFTTIVPTMEMAKELALNVLKKLQVY